MFYRLPFFESSKTARSLYGVCLVFLTGAVFFLDIVTKNAIAFDIFYFPSIMLMTWFFGGRPGFLMAVLAAVMWFIAQEDMEAWGGKDIFYVDGMVHLVTFSLVCWMTSLIRKRNLQLDEKSKELARSNTELEQFAFKAAHDLQSPLTTIFGYSEFLSQQQGVCPAEGAKECRQSIDGILHGSRRMSDMIRQLLEYSRVMKEDKKPPAADLNKVLREVLETLHAGITEKKAEVSYDPLPAVAVNEGLAGLLFQNLVGNALKYCEQTPRIHISAVRRGKEWLFSVTDNGIGIHEADRERVFIMFEKLPTRHQYPGAGIGLATCQKIVNRYGGRIWIEAAPEGGSIFCFTLPAV